MSVELEASGLLSGLRTLITGAASGIGRATVLNFAREGACVAAVDVNHLELGNTVAETGLSSDVVFSHVGDVTSESQIAAAVDAAEGAFGGLDCVVCVAGVEPPPVPTHELSVEEWDRVHAVNLRGVFLTAKHGIRAMLRSDSLNRSCVITGSPTGFSGFAVGQASYSASKAGVHGLARTLAREYATHGIRVNVSVPGIIDTPPNAEMLADPARRAAFLDRFVPAGRPGRPDEVAQLHVWLASDRASYCTGGYYSVDGGQLS